MTDSRLRTFKSREIRTEIDNFCRNYGRKLLGDLGCSSDGIRGGTASHPAGHWADCGLMHLVNGDGGGARLCPVPLPSCADGALEAFRALTGVRVLPATDGATLLTERAAIAGAPQSSSGHCRLLPTIDGRIGLNLPRADDWDLLPAWLDGEGARDWPALQALVRTRPTATLIERAHLLGLAVADALQVPVGRSDWLDITYRAGSVSQPRERAAPRVLDLSSLWAGPLCSHLWQAAGAQVTKVESARRPDGARAGPPEFFELLHRGKQSAVLELHTPAGQAQLLAMMQEVDIVLEASRPRALRQMGIVAEDVIDANPGLTWVSITGHGRGEPQANWIAFGDDAGIAAGLSAILHRVSGEWLICGDAIADPLTGLHAAVAGWAGWLAGGGLLLDLSLEKTVRHCVTATAPADGDYRERYRHWQQYLQANHIEARAPGRRRGG